MECEKTEEEKFKSFMGILDGKMKFVPLYRPVCLTVVDNNFKEEFVQEEKPYMVCYRNPRNKIHKNWFIRTSFYVLLIRHSNFLYKFMLVNFLIFFFLKSIHIHI